MDPPEEQDGAVRRRFGAAAPSSPADDDGAKKTKPSSSRFGRWGLLLLGAATVYLGSRLGPTPPHNGAAPSAARASKAANASLAALGETNDKLESPAVGVGNPSKAAVGEAQSAPRIAIPGATDSGINEKKAVVKSVRGSSDKVAIKSVRVGNSSKAEDPSGAAKDKRQSGWQIVAGPSKVGGPPNNNSTASSVAVGGPPKGAGESNLFRSQFPRRFPLYGSPEFGDTCQWAVDAAEGTAARPVQAYLVPWVLKSEGLSAWVCAVAQAFIYGRKLARLNRGFAPRLRLELEGANVAEVVRPPGARRNGWEAAPPTAGSAYQWCNSTPNCKSISEGGPWDVKKKRGAVPLYRHAYTDLEAKWIHAGDYDNLTATLPGFSVETGMACALNSMWEPSPRLAEHEPELFTRILPELRSKEALVLSLYLRTGWTDGRMSADIQKASWNDGADQQIWKEKADEFLRPFVDCAEQLEREYFSEQSAYSGIVWMVASDSPLLKQYVNDTYHKESTNEASDPSIVRRVVFTSAEGAHTKSSAHPSQTATARAFTDWYLLGESDAVITDNHLYSFGLTGALRTARPLYIPRQNNSRTTAAGGHMMKVNIQTAEQPKGPFHCTRQVLVHEARDPGDSSTKSKISIASVEEGKPAPKSLSRWQIVSVEEGKPAPIIASPSGAAKEVGEPPKNDRSASSAAVVGGPSTSKEIDLAVCVVGAVRTFAEPDVVESFGKIRFPDGTRFFHHLFVGTELSLRGQQALGADNAGGMARALANSTAFRFQYQENEFTCDQMTTGKFHKVSACMKMVDECSRNEGVAFKSIAFIRPDLAWRCPTFPPYHTVNGTDWYIYAGEEVFAISGDEASRRVAAGITETECCDSAAAREPQGCFAPGLKEPLVNFLQDRHFASQLQKTKSPKMDPKCQYGIRRSAEAHAMVKKYTHMGLHGKYRPTVLRCAVPQTSPVVTDFPSLSYEERKRMLEDLLSVPHATECTKNGGDAPPPPQTAGVVEVQHGLNHSSRSQFPGRFPVYGSPEFVDICRWAVDGAKTAVARTVKAYLVPWVYETEGLASWACAVAQAYIYGRKLARLNPGFSPRLRLELEGVNLTAVVQPPGVQNGDAGWEAAPPTAGGAYQWCNSTPNCKTITEGGPWDRARHQGAVPLYRHAYTDVEVKWIHAGDYDNLTAALPGFSVETGMACALNSMWEPSPALAQYEPELFTGILPELRRDKTLVLSLYLRTGWADLRMTGKKSEKYELWDEGADQQIWREKADKFLRPFVACAQQLEQEYFSEQSAYSVIVWMVASDSPLLKEYVNGTYHNEDVVLAPHSGANEASKISVARRVMFTSAEGTHTKSSAHPKHVDVARAFTDWYLLGESDAVIADNYLFSFGPTAALRTARPLYSVRSTEHGKLAFGTPQKADSTGEKVMNVDGPATAARRHEDCTRLKLVHEK